MHQRTPKHAARSAGVVVAATGAIAGTGTDVHGQCVPEERAVLLPDVVQAGDWFGTAVDIEDEVAVAGAPFDNNSRGTAYIFHRDPQQQDQWTLMSHLSAPDGMEFESFGGAVALSNPWVVVGAHNAPAGEAVGAAYLFHRNEGGDDNWGFVRKVTASDGDNGDLFGVRVAIDGKRLVIGASSDEDPVGSLGGAAYVFGRDVGGFENWGQITKLTAPGGVEGQEFGSSVALDDGTAVVGARESFVEGSNPGRAYVYERDAGGEDQWGFVMELTASDGADHDQFGWAASIDDDLAVIGAAAHDDAGVDDTGAAYLFRRDPDDPEQWLEVAKLTASDASANDLFGTSVDVNGESIIVGAPNHDAACPGDPFCDSGAAYVFGRHIGGTENWGELARLTDPAGAAADFFGLTVGLSGETLITGAFGADGAGEDAGKAMAYAPLDSDGDGLYDCWEANGIDVDGDGAPEVDLPALGANVMRKDLFVEVDLSEHADFPLTAQAMVVQAFVDAPVENPDTTEGIDLHLQVDESDLSMSTVWITDDSGWPPEFDDLKDGHFGTVAERSAPNADLILSAKAKAFRYCLFAEGIDDGSLGVGELPGNDFFLTLDEFFEPPTDTCVASTFMHELGHNLGLEHGGVDSIQGKPNYISVMSYLLVEPRNFSADFWELDFSRADLAPLDEEGLDEPSGVGSPDGPYQEIFMPYGVTVDDGMGGETREIRYAQLNGSAVDWDDDGDAGQADSEQDINFLGNDAPISGVDQPSFPETLRGHDDWGNVRLAIGRGGDFEGRTHTTIPEEKITGELLAWIDDTLPPPPGACVPPDLDCDGTVGLTDLLIVLNDWGACPPPPEECPADIDGSGTVGLTDLLEVLDAWGA